MIAASHADHDDVTKRDHPSPVLFHNLNAIIIILSRRGGNCRALLFQGRTAQINKQSVTFFHDSGLLRCDVVRTELGPNLGSSLDKRFTRAYLNGTVKRRSPLRPQQTFRFRACNQSTVAVPVDGGHLLRWDNIPRINKPNKLKLSGTCLEYPSSATRTIPNFETEWQKSVWQPLPNVSGKRWKHHVIGIDWSRFIAGNRRWRCCACCHTSIRSSGLRTCGGVKGNRTLRKNVFFFQKCKKKIKF